MKPLSFCYVTAQYFPHVGGVERYTDNLAKELLRQGHSVIIVTSAYKEEPSIAKAGDVTVYRLPSLQLMNGRYPVLLRGGQPGKQLAAQSFDHVIINTRFYPLSIWGARLAKKKKIPCLIIEHGAGHLSMGLPLIDWAVRLTEHAFSFWLRHYRPRYAGVSQAAAQWVKHFHLQAEPEPAYNTVDFAMLHAYMEEEHVALRNQLGISENAKIIAYVGRLVKEKGIMPLVEAVQNIEKERPVALVIAGNGPQEAAVQQAAQSSSAIHYMGAVPHKQAIQILQESDIFCLPSDSEGFPTAVLEAAFCGCCVVATPYGGTKEIILGEEYGILLPGNEACDIQDGLEAVLSDWQQGCLKAEKLKQRVLTQFTWERTAQTIVSIARRQREA